MASSTRSLGQAYALAIFSCHNKAQWPTEMVRGKGLFSLQFILYHGKKSGQALKAGTCSQKLERRP